MNATKWLSYFIIRTKANIKRLDSTAKMNALYFPFILAQASPDFLPKLGLALKIILAVGFLYGVVLIMKGAAAFHRGEDGKDAIVGGVLLAGAAPLMYALYDIFVGGGIAPKF